MADGHLEQILNIERMVRWVELRSHLMTDRFLR